MKGALKSGLGRSLFSSGIGPLLSQILALTLVPLLFRLYTPRDFGVWAAVQSIAIIAGSLVSLRFDLALVLERKLEAASQLFFAIIGVVCLLFDCCWFLDRRFARASRFLGT